MSITIYHNPRWGKSRKTLQILNELGKDCSVVEYLKNTPNINQFLNDENKLIEMMFKYPKIIERPIVVTKKGAVIARPPEKVFDIL